MARSKALNPKALRLKVLEMVKLAINTGEHPTMFALLFARAVNGMTAEQRLAATGGALHIAGGLLAAADNRDAVLKLVADKYAVIETQS